jgi:hypothetical protein
MHRLFLTVAAGALLAVAAMGSLAGPDHNEHKVKKPRKPTRGAAMSMMKKGHGKMDDARHHGKVNMSMGKRGHGKMVDAMAHGHMDMTPKKPDQNGHEKESHGHKGSHGKK